MLDFRVNYSRVSVACGTVPWMTITYRCWNRYLFVTGASVL